MRNFENEVLVRALTNDGPVTELEVEMQKNPQTTSGYQRVFPQGPALSLFKRHRLLHGRNRYAPAASL